MPKARRVNKSKDQLVAEAQHLARVNREKSLVKLMFPIIANQETIYDAQTVVAALSGFIKSELDKSRATIIVKSLDIDLTKEKDSKIKEAIIQMKGLVELEKADEVANLLKRFGDILTQHSAKEYMKRPMSDIKVEQIVA